MFAAMISIKEENRDARPMPPNRKYIGRSFPFLFAKRYSSPVVQSPPAMANIGWYAMVRICSAGKNVRNSITANPAPAFMPNIPGSASGFPVTVCMMHPASARPIPHRTARTILGTRNCATTTEVPSICGWNMLRTAAEKGILA